MLQPLMRHTACGRSLQRARRVATKAAASAAAAIGGADGALTVGCRMVVPYHRTAHGQQLVLVGSCETLGNWDPKKGVKFTWCEGHSHVADLELPIHTPVACKLVVLSDNGSATWEPEEDRELLLAPSTLVSRAAGYTVLAHWGFPGCTQVLANALRRGTSLGGARSSLSPNSHASGGANGHANGHVNGHANGSSSGFLAGVKKVLAQASSLDKAVLPGTASWEEDGMDAEEAGLSDCQITVLVPKNGPKLKPEQSLVLVGGSAALGRWDPAEGLPLERAGEDSPVWTARAELPLGEGLQAKVVVVDAVSGKAQTWEPCENRTLARHSGARPVVITAYWGAAPTHSLEVDRLSAAASASNPQVVAMLRQQLSATATQLDGMRRERDEARKAIAASEDQMRHLQHAEKGAGDKTYGRFEMVQLAEQLQTTRRLYETTRKEAMELGGAVGVTRQLCDAAKAELRALGAQLESARRAYEALAPEVERMEKKLSSTSRAFEATRPELVALEAQLESARSLFDRTLSKIEAAKVLAAGNVEVQTEAVRRRVDNRVREMQLAKF
ncbi:hypothetical protein GPECTOR_1g812 [Gonium pectorale]|uniref:CBM20 domain-containing protein n=1 Tax=Gonium pectorale TaxID=33097 RepID=A0A150H4B2_GONPE|nr:hypothetical protein GPECTOR_1g812 [Gonium pectorale]|eukprot:KXZ56901.1 hypothetical protein GPECTOR_1g812 [Gonium pectorale]